MELNKDLRFEWNFKISLKEYILFKWGFKDDWYLTTISKHSEIIFHSQENDVIFKFPRLCLQATFW